ncbi:hypothetical protein O181_082895 [Austropuccinia psidii MF-1]|uniref:Uncharacterized protein n=1 Tax=Austropuccinia psidii MF-1 TaxID=1389203 RepID=A0A9Q3FM34_9BASI|nr:hypothetical protein [Austropuccinia psidii MF-1]
MVHTIDERSYSVHPDGSGQGRGKTSSRPSRPSSRKGHLEDARVSHHFPRSVPTTFDINSETELIQGDVLRFKPLQSGSHGNISVPVQALVQNSQRGRVGNIPKPLERGYELLISHKELSGSGEDNRDLRTMESIALRCG